MQTLTFAWGPMALLFLLIFVFILIKKKQTSSIPSLRIPFLYIFNNLPKSHEKVSAKKWPLFTIIFWSLLVLALMRPMWVGEPIPIEREGRNLLLAVDISESMQTPDLFIDKEPFDRLNVAKNILSDFIDKRHSDRIGLLLFGSEAFLHVPLTFDHKTLKRFLKESMIGFLGPKTAIGDAIGLSVKKLRDQEKGDRIIILLTDGQNNSGKLDPKKAAELAKENNIKIFTVGMASDELKINTFLGPATVNPAKDLEEGEETLKEVANLTGGQYFRGKSTESVKEIYKEIDKLIPTPNEPLSIVPQKELFMWPLSLAVFLFIIQLLRPLFRFKAYGNIK